MPKFWKICCGSKDSVVSPEPPTHVTRAPVKQPDGCSSPDQASLADSVDSVGYVNEAQAGVMRNGVKKYVHG